jgi:hypothetical protein
MIQQWQGIFKKAQYAEYNAEQGRGVPFPVTWRGVEIWPFDGRVHCSGAVWAATVELLREYTDQEEEIDFEAIERMRRAAWILDGVRSGLPEVLGRMGLGTYSNERPDAGDICQIWRANGTGHLFVCVGEERGRLLEWSASKSHLAGTGTKHLVGEPTEYHTFRFHSELFGG